VEIGGHLPKGRDWIQPRSRAIWSGRVFGATGLVCSHRAMLTVLLEQLRAGLASEQGDVFGVPEGREEGRLVGFDEG